MTNTIETLVHIDAVDLERAAELGGGNVSEGIRVALRMTPRMLSEMRRMMVLSDREMGDGDAAREIAAALISEATGEKVSPWG